MQQKFIRANYRITKEQFKWVKKSAKRSHTSEAEVIRHILQDLINK